MPFLAFVPFSYYNALYRGDGAMTNSLGNKKIFAKNLASFMDQKGIDRQQLATDLGFPYTTITDWLKGKTYPRIDKIEMMARYFRCEKSDLIENHDLNPDIMTANESVFIDLFRQLNEEGQEELLKHARLLTASGLYIKSNSPRMVEGA